MPVNTLVICEILDRLGSPNPFSTTSPLEFKFTGPKTTKSVALEESLRSVVRRFQELEQKVIEQKSEVAVKKPIQAGQIDQHIGAQLGTMLLAAQEEAAQVEIAGPHVPSIRASKSKSSSFSFDLYR